MPLLLHSPPAFKADPRGGTHSVQVMEVALSGKCPSVLCTILVDIWRPSSGWAWAQLLCQDLLQIHERKHWNVLHGSHNLCTIMLYLPGWLLGQHPNNIENHFTHSETALQMLIIIIPCSCTFSKKVGSDGLSGKPVYLYWCSQCRMSWHPMFLQSTVWKLSHYTILTTMGLSKSPWELGL